MLDRLGTERSSIEERIARDRRGTNVGWCANHAVELICSGDEPIWKSTPTKANYSILDPPRSPSASHGEGFRANWNYEAGFLESLR